MYLIVGDIHLSDRPKDEYRFKLFPWLLKQQQQLQPEMTIILGDMTEKKDKHSSTLVNKVVDGLTMLEPPVYILKGNHDYIDPNNPFFKFLNKIDGLQFITQAETIDDVLFIPHSTDQATFNMRCSGHPKLTLAHQTFDGAIADASGARLSGLSTAAIEAINPRLGVYSGDIHRPQRAGIVTYVGTPYHVRFGDDFEPRVLWVDKRGKALDMYFPAPKKWSLTIRDADDLFRNKKLKAGDQIKLIVEMAREEAVGWKQTRQQVLEMCQELKLDVYGVDLKVNTSSRRERIRIGDVKTVRSHAEVLTAFCKAENLPSKIKNAGLGFVENV